jgi:hypothetical protein
MQTLLLSEVERRRKRWYDYDNDDGRRIREMRCKGGGWMGDQTASTGRAERRLACGIGAPRSRCGRAARSGRKEPEGPPAVGTRGRGKQSDRPLGGSLIPLPAIATGLIGKHGHG